MIFARPLRLLPPVLLFCLAGCFLAQPDLAARSFSAALQSCSSGLLPGLFPFLVLSRLILEQPGADVLAVPLRPVCRACGCRSSRAPLLLLLGWLGGYTAFAAALGESVRRGEMGTAEAERLLIPGTMASPGFVFAVGGGMLGSPALGAALWLSGLLASLLCGVLAALPARLLPSADPVPSAKVSAPPQPGGLAGAISAAAWNSLSVCGCAAFFQMALSLTAARLPFAPFSLAALSAGLEICTGCAAFAALGGTPAVFGAAAALSLLSLSVWFQLRALLGRELSLRPLLLSRLFHLPLGLSLLRGFLALLPGTAPAVNTLSRRVISLNRLPAPQAFALFALLCCVLEYSCRKR